MVSRTEESAFRYRAALTGHGNTFWMVSWPQLSFRSAFVSLASQSISRGIGEGATANLTAIMLAPRFDRSPFMGSTPRTTTTVLPETVGARLLTERKRLGLTQIEMAEHCGVSRWAQLNFEKDTNLPGGAYLIAAHHIGVDILYVLTATPPSYKR